MGLVPIDSPILDNLSVTLFDQPVPDTPQIAQFIDRTPKLKAPHEAHIRPIFDRSDIFVSLPWTCHIGLRFRITHVLSD